MHELIKVQNDNDRITLSARDLYEFLKLEERFSKWIERMLGYGFEESIDYTPYQMVHPQNLQELQDYQLSIEMAKEIAMIQRNEKGKQARRYFIELEKKWNSPEKIMARAITISQKELSNLRVENEVLKPKALFADAVTTSEDSILIGQLSKLIKQNGHEIGQNRLFDWMREHKYLCSKGENYNMPTQKSMELRLFEIKERTINNPDGSVRTTRTTKVTGKGQIYFVNKFISNI